MPTSVPQTPEGRTPEARVLVVMTGGTICMQKSVDGYVPARGFLERCMAPRPEFNDGTEVDPVTVSVDDGRLCDPQLCTDALMTNHEAVAISISSKAGGRGARD